MQIGPKYKICKRLGASVFEKCQTQKFQLAEARAPRRISRRRGSGSDFGVQLIEKQKARFTYGLAEKQFYRYVHEAMEQKGVPAIHGLMTRLESRLDNVVYRAGFATTRRAARQMVSHGHVVVNGKKMNIPSHLCKMGDVISVRPESRESALFTMLPEKATEHRLPQWLTAEEGGFAVRVSGEPVAQGSDVGFDPAVIVQFYSR